MERTELMIFLKTPIGKIISMDCPLTSTIKWLKEKIEDKEAIHPASCYLTYQMKRLDDENTLKDYNVQEHDTIFIHVHMRGD